METYAQGTLCYYPCTPPHGIFIPSHSISVPLLFAEVHEAWEATSLLEAHNLCNSGVRKIRRTPNELNKQHTL
jgi:hypothetical protein